MEKLFRIYTKSYFHTAKECYSMAERTFAVETCPITIYACIFNLYPEKLLSNHFMSVEVVTGGRFDYVSVTHDLLKYTQPKPSYEIIIDIFVAVCASLHNSMFAVIFFFVLKKSKQVLLKSFLLVFAMFFLLFGLFFSLWIVQLHMKSIKCG